MYLNDVKNGHLLSLKSLFFLASSKLYIPTLSFALISFCSINIKNRNKEKYNCHNYRQASLKRKSQVQTLSLHLNTPCNFSIPSALSIFFIYLFPLSSLFSLFPILSKEFYRTLWYYLPPLSLITLYSLSIPSVLAQLIQFCVISLLHKLESFHRSNQFHYAVFWSNQCYKFLKKKLRK